MTRAAPRPLAVSAQTHRGADHRVRLLQPRGRPEPLAVQRQRRQRVPRAEVVGERERQAEQAGQLRRCSRSSRAARRRGWSPSPGRRGDVLDAARRRSRCSSPSWSGKSSPPAPSSRGAAPRPCSRSVPGARPRPRSMRPGCSASSVPNCSAITSGAWFGSITPPEPTRMRRRCPPRGGRSAPPAPSSRCRACCGARRPRSAGSRAPRRAGPGRASSRAPRRRSRALGDRGEVEHGQGNGGGKRHACGNGAWPPRVPRRGNLRPGWISSPSMRRR